MITNAFTLSRIAVPMTPRPQTKSDPPVASNTHSIPKEKTMFRRVRRMLGNPTVTRAMGVTPEEATTTESGESTAFEVSAGIHAIRCSCIERLKFEVEYGLKRGTTDNSYLIKGDTREATVLIDIPSESFQTTFLLALQKVIAAKRIGRVILTHLDPDSVSVVKALIRLIAADGQSTVDIFASSPAIRLIKSSFGHRRRSESADVSSVSGVESEGEASDIAEKAALNKIMFDERMELSDTLSLEFIRTATPRWPDMLAVYIPRRQILFSSQLYSAHVASPLTEVKDTAFDLGGWQMYGDDWRYFFDTMLAPAVTQVGKALADLNCTSNTDMNFTNVYSWFSQLLPWKAPAEESASTRPVVGICPNHGPIIRNALHEVMESYEEWIQSKKSSTATIAVFYASAYGNTAALAQAISHGASKSGIRVKTVNLEVAALPEVEKAIQEADGFIIGSPTLGGHLPTQVQTALGTIIRSVEAKPLPCGVFGSFGWSGEAVDELDQRLRDAGFKFAFDPIKVRMKPTSKDLQICEESGTDLAQLVEQKLKRKKKQDLGSGVARTASSVDQAVGRIIGSLCVISGKDGDVESGMLASWISQATFNPPGITVSVKKDRAIENVLLDGNRFVINILGEGKEKDIVKHMLQPFKPGENRFDGLVTEVSEETGCVIIHKAVAYLECTVNEKMDAGDHWVVYATVNGGSVLDGDTFSAVHHRNTGGSY